MWNQNGNGNGQGNGYGQQPQTQQGYQQPQVQQGYGQQDVYERLNNAKQVGGARYPFIDPGQHKLALAVLEEFIHSSDGPSTRAILKVLESRVHPIGSFVVKIWKIVKPPFKPGMTTDADEFADFCCKLKNAPAGYPIGNDIRVLLKERPLDQLARGTVIDCNAVMNKKGNYAKTYWSPVQQTPQDIASMRQRIEADGVPNANGPSQQGGQQGFQNQYAPQQMQPPMQQAPYQQPGQFQQQAAPQYAPQPQAQPGAGAPPGGFLANVPTNNGGNGQGGNQGGGW